MVSSTFKDLEGHRAALIKAIHDYKLHANVMENDSAKLANVVQSSLQMVRDSAAYICIISLKYGQVPECPENPDRLSLTELEFHEAQRLGRPTFLFIMGDDHPVRKRDIEKDPANEKKLDVFRERAMKDAPGSKVNRVYATFDSLEEFKERFGSSLAELKLALESTPATSPGAYTPADFHAKQDYIPRFKFIGREEQLAVLSEWAVDKTDTILLFRSIGGNGKSALTWHWARDEAGRFATKCRPAGSPWAGRFWYSFYERGATMTDFCRHALAYMTGESIAELEKKPFSALQHDLLRQLHACPWLLVLDGMERVLVHYHRLDPSDDPDEAADHPTDYILEKRDPTDAIRDEDNELLLALGASSPSKIVISTRLLPRVLLNAAGAGIPGVRPLELPGLNDADAEAFLRSCGDTGSRIQGDSNDIRCYLRDNCDNHPLTIGALGGLILGYRKAPGDFTKWLDDPYAGGALDFGALKLEQRRNHILKAALDNLPTFSRQLLSILALLYGSVDYATIEALSPHRPLKPEDEPDQPMPPEMDDFWEYNSEHEKAAIRKAHAHKVAEWEQRPAIEDWRAKCRAAERDLDATLTDLTRHRGLLQYDGRSHLYELHPVVRSVVTRNLAVEEKTSAGERILDHFTSLPHNPYQQARSLADIAGGLHIVRTLLKLGRRQQAAAAYRGDLSSALLFNLEGFEEALSLLRPLFPYDWSIAPEGVEEVLAAHLSNNAAIALDHTGQLETALACYASALRSDLSLQAWISLPTTLRNISLTLEHQNRPAAEARVLSLALEVAELLERDEDVFLCRLWMFDNQSRHGQWAAAGETWAALDVMGRNWSRARYRAGDAEYLFARSQFRQRRLQEIHLASAERLAMSDHSRRTIRNLHRLRGEWQLERAEWAPAIASLRRALEMAHESRLPDVDAETALVLAKHHLDPRSVTRADAERLARSSEPSHYHLAPLWLALGDVEQAKIHALAAYERAWADGEPYVLRYELTRITELLNELKVSIPKLAPYDPGKDEPFAWEADVRAAIEKIRTEIKTKTQGRTKRRSNRT